MKINIPLLPVFTVLAFTFCQDLRATDREYFSSPQEAVDDLVTAAKSNDTNAMLAIFGPEGHNLLSPDAVQAAAERQIFVRRLIEDVELATNNDGTVSLLIGKDAWPFPIPLEKWAGKWYFDPIAGRQEILNRRVGMDELGAIDVCRTYVQAQREYASQDRMDDGILAYAQYLHSSPGKHDGLFWPAEPGQPLSPLGPLVADAHEQGYRHAATMLNDQLAPYHGYLFKVLTSQGRHAPGGKYNYVINGHMIAGFGLVAWPAVWGNTGIMTFIVNQQGKVYQTNLGPRTTRVVARMNAFDPDNAWTMVQ
jgi:hypothetical protein